MKNYKSRLLSVILMLVLVVSLGTPALAVVSQYDEQYLTDEQQQAIQDATDAWWDAYNAGDEQGMADAHQAAENERANEKYSGGADGSEYHPWDDNDSGGGYSGGGYYDPPAPATYTITATAGTGGSISPSGSTSVTGSVCSFSGVIFTSSRLFGSFFAMRFTSFILNNGMKKGLIFQSDPARILHHSFSLRANMARSNRCKTKIPPIVSIGQYQCL
jgi:hypothetical protein